MNNQLSPGARPVHPEPAGGHHEPEEMGLMEWLGNLWEGRRLILVALLVFVLFGGLYVWRAAPVYQVDAMLQVQPKSAGSNDPAFAKMAELFAAPTEAEGEVEILQSNLVLGRTVEALNLDLVAQPKLLPVVGAALARRNPDAPHIAVDVFTIPEYLRGQTFRLVALKGGAFRWESPKGVTLATGQIGEDLTADYGGDTLKLRVAALSADPGQKFTLSRKPVVEAMESLRLNLQVAEKGKLTNVLGLTLKCPDPVMGAKILNEIVNQYILHRIERKNASASQALAALQKQLPVVKARLDAAEDKLNRFRTSTGSVDISQEGGAFLQQSVALNGQISALQQRRQELLRTYKPTADVVATLDKQIAQLQGENGRVEGRLHALPGNQQEVVRLSRDVQANNDLYTSLLANIQQLQVASAGEVGSVTVVDPATPNPEPVEPRKAMLMGLFTFFGVLVGLGLAILRKAFGRGVEDHRLIEARLGLPILVTVPHSKLQEAHSLAMQKGEDGLHLLAALNPDDLATESFRSLRTTLHFAAKDAGSNVIMVTGPAPDIGKSFTAGNLAVVLAQAGSRVLAVDADLRKGSLHRYFWSKDRAGGLSDVLARLADWEKVVHKTEVPGLDLMMSGSIPQNPSELLMGEAFGEFLAQARKAYDFVILDAPPVLAVTDAAIIGAQAGAVLLVAKSGRHPMDELRVCLRRLLSHGIPVAGWVFNDIPSMGLVSGYSAYRYAYHYKYE